MLSERNDHDDVGQLKSSSEDNQEITQIYKTLSGVSRPQAQCLLLSLCSSLQMFGVSLFAVYGENQTEYFVGPGPVGMVIYKNKVLVGRYLWQRITKLHFKDEIFEVRVIRKNGLETSFFFQMSDRSDCKCLWKCCVEHHVFRLMPVSTNQSFRLSDVNQLPHKQKHNSTARLPTMALPQINVRKNKPKEDLCMRPKHQINQAANVTNEPIRIQTAPPAVHRLESRTGGSQEKCNAPWENVGSLSGLFNPRFPPDNNEEQQQDRRPQRHSRCLDGDRPVRKHRRRSRSHGNNSSVSDSERVSSKSEQCRRRRKHCHLCGRSSDSTRRCRARSQSPDAVTWKHIQKQLVEPDGLTDRQTEEIPYKEVRVSGETKTPRRSQRGHRHHRRPLAIDVNSKMELVPPLPVIKAADTSCGLPTDP